jgi:7,8-dihydroneopterin aldolase/epimerase/oxygenase
VTGLALHAYHGVMQHEAKVGQTFGLDLVLDIDLTGASRSDKLADTVGYDQVVDVASKAFCARRYRLVEAAAGAVAEAVLDRFPTVMSVRVTVHKPHAPIAATFADVGVTITRARKKNA